MLAANLQFHETQLADFALEEEVLTLLSQSEKRLPCRLLYDETGSKLFERICETEEYYPTRTETELLKKHGAEMADRIETPSFILEYGAGNTQKARLLLQQMIPPVTSTCLLIFRETI